MRKKYKKIINYQQLIAATVKERYFDFVLGVLVVFTILTLSYRNLAKNTKFHIAFRLPTFKFASKTIKKTGPKKPLKIYVVSEGDDLWHIAEKFYGSGFNAYDITVANKLDPSSAIEPGQKLVIPDVKRREPTVGEILTGASTTQVTYTEGKYVVQPGDSLSIIAQKVYGDLYAWPRLLQANKLASPDNIEIGMILTIPR